MAAALALALIGVVADKASDDNTAEDIWPQLAASNVVPISVSAFAAIEHARSHITTP
ncbi:MAG: hypothetical protein Q8K74_02120 [Candidatus Nitrotoga sp.]|nr:hypothetical protein [Candidatus Nitrotoga sp.]